MGGISARSTIRATGSDIGGHRFFAKSDRVMEWWLRMLPCKRPKMVRRPSNTSHGAGHPAFRIRARPGRRGSRDAAAVPQVRIYCLRRFFDYPISLSKDHPPQACLWRTFKIGRELHSERAIPSQTGGDPGAVLINRFGRELFGHVSQVVHQKVWGVPCDRISAEWGARASRASQSGRAAPRPEEGVQRRPRRHRAEG